MRHFLLLFCISCSVFLEIIPATAETNADASATPSPDARPDRLADVKQSLRKSYSEVTHLTIEDYLAAPDNRLLVDVRKPEEYEVSHIPGAIHVEDPEALAQLAADNPDKSLVLYCSVGRRSSKAARDLMSRGHDQVANLEGSIFEWANEGRPLVNAQGSTAEVHPYNFWWGWRYLDPDRPPAVDPSTQQ